MNVLALIPARGGSKGIPRKNLLMLAGKPLVAHSIEHALHCRSITRVIVSTDDPEISSISQRFGAEVPFLRPLELAEDHVFDWPVFEHALRYLNDSEGYRPDIVVHLRPTSPYRKPEWIDTCIKLLIEHPGADSVRSVSPPEKHPYRMYRIDEAGFLDPLLKDEHPHPYLLRRQDLPPVYYYNCVLDVTRPETILNKKSMTGDRVWPFLMDADEVMDIDTRKDLAMTRSFMERIESKGI